jgi:hypothetical protein
MKYAAEMGSVAIIYISVLIKLDVGIQKLIEGYTGTQTGCRSYRKMKCLQKHCSINEDRKQQ